MLSTFQQAWMTVRKTVRRLGGAPRRVLLLKTWNDRVGDLVLVTGVLRHYRRRYADCRLELACADDYVELFRHCPHVDAVRPLGEFHFNLGGHRRPKPWNAGRYDRVILMRRNPAKRDYRLLDSFRPAWTAALAGDPLLVDPALARQQEELLDCAVPVPAGEPPVHELEAQLALLRAQGGGAAGPEALWPEFWPGPGDAERAAALWRDVPPDRPAIVLAPCGSASVRDWNPAGYREVFAALAPCTVVLAGTQRDRHFAKGMEISGLPGVRVVDLIGRTSIAELVAVIRRADLVMGAESGAFHAAAALGKRAVCIAGGGHWGRFVPWGLADRTRILTRQLDCFGCSWKCRRPSVECIQGVAPADVVQSVRELLAGKPEPLAGVPVSARMVRPPVRAPAGRAVVLIPCHRSGLDPDEERAARQTLQVLGAHECRVVCPAGLDLPPLLAGLPAERLPPEYFRSVRDYSRMLLSLDFYDRFRDREYLLICQLDAYVFRDELHDWCGQGYDYIGAPWGDAPFLRNPKLQRLLPWTVRHPVLARRLHRCDFRVGNGGLSLRRVQAFRRVLRDHPGAAARWQKHEDLFWSLWAPVLAPEFRIAPEAEAMRFAVELAPRKYVGLQDGRLPFGCHAWRRYDPEFWAARMAADGAAGR